jgi:hypothetical protein
VSQLRGGRHRRRVFRYEEKAEHARLLNPDGSGPNLKEATMKFDRLTILVLVLSLSVVGATAASAASVTGSAALALAGVVAPYSYLPAAEKMAVAKLFEGHTSISYARKISVTADKIVCRTGNVDITARSCELIFKNGKRTLKAREANELYATEVMAGVPSDGAAGSVFESLSKLNCTLDPKAIKDKAGAGAECTFEPDK